MFESEGEEGLTEVYKHPGVQQHSLPVLTWIPQEPVNLGQDVEVDLESDLDRSVHSVW